MLITRKSVFFFKKECIFLIRRNHNLSIKMKTDRKMRGWQAHSYGDIEELQLSENMKIPLISSSDEVLVKVQTAGVNPIDVAMLRGYGAPILNLARKATTDIEFPLTFGREFTGVVVQKGLAVDNRLKTGQQVWGVVPVQRQGAHGEYVVVPQTSLTKIPNGLNSIEGSGVLYSGLTAWAGLFLFSDFKRVCENVLMNSESSLKNKRVLVLGASGSVGSLAAQILKAEEATVIGSCSTDAVPTVQTLGINHIIDYTDQSSINDFSQCGPYDIILDCAGQGPDVAQKYGWQFKEYITFSAPLLRNVDEHGLVVGMAKNVVDLTTANLKSVSTKQGLVKWAYFVPSLRGIEYLKNLVERKKLLPKIDSVFSFTETPDAYRKVKDGHLRGKVVIDFEK